MLPHRLGEELQLEAIEPRHAAELFALTDRNRAYLRRWLPWLDANREEKDTLAFIRKSQRQLAENDGFQCAIRHRSHLVGMVGFHAVDWTNRRASLGYWLSEDAGGKGIMTTACRALAQHARSAWRLNRLEIRCAVENRRSRAIPERLGYRLEGTIRQAEWLYDHFVDHVVYGLLASDELR